MQRRTFLTSGLGAGVFGISSFAQTERINVSLPPKTDP